MGRARDLPRLPHAPRDGLCAIPRRRRRHSHHPRGRNLGSCARLVGHGRQRDRHPRCRAPGRWHSARDASRREVGDPPGRSLLPLPELILQRLRSHERPGAHAGARDHARRRGPSPPGGRLHHHRPPGQHVHAGDPGRGHPHAATGRNLHGAAAGWFHIHLRHAGATAREQHRPGLGDGDVPGGRNPSLATGQPGDPAGQC